MKRLLGLILVLSIPATAAALDFGVEFGFRQQSGSTDGVGVSAKSQIGYTLGLSAFLPFEGALGMRTGLAYVQRPLLLETETGGAGEAKIDLSYFDVPLAVAYKFEEYASVFAGIALALKLGDSVSDTGTLAGTKVMDGKDMLMPIQFGASFKFAPQLGATVFFETIPGDVAKDLNGYRAVGANIVFTYD